MPRKIFAFAAALFLIASPHPAIAQNAAAQQGVTIVIQTQDLESAESLAVAELARLLADGANFRVMTLIGQGSVQSMSDLFTQRYVDAAIVPWDVMRHFRDSQRIPGVQNKLQYVARLFSQEIHVLARMQYGCLADLDGRKVNFGPKSGGAALTAALMFSALKVNVQPVYLENSEAFEKLKTGEIDAMVYVGGKPAPAFKRIRYSDRVHFLDVDYVEALQQDYLPGVMTNDDYPDLIAPDETVSTISVGTVLMMAGHKSQSDQFKHIAMFAERFFLAAEKLRSGPYHPKWRELNIAAPAAGWVRFPAAQAWLDANAARLAKLQTPPAPVAVSPAAAPAADDPAKVRELFRKFIETQGATSDADREALFNQFVRWYEKQKNQ